MDTTTIEHIRMNSIGVSMRRWSFCVWNFLHGLSFLQERNDSIYPLIMHLPKMLPCTTCGIHFLLYIEQHKPTSSGQDWGHWFVTFHNDVNKRTGKTLVSYEEARIQHSYQQNTRFIVSSFMWEFLFIRASITMSDGTDYKTLLYLCLKTIGIDTTPLWMGSCLPPVEKSTVEWLYDACQTSPHTTDSSDPLSRTCIFAWWVRLSYNNTDQTNKWEIIENLIGDHIYLQYNDIPDVDVTMLRRSRQLANDYISSLVHQPTEDNKPPSNTWTHRVTLAIITVCIIVVIVLGGRLLYNKLHQEKRS